MGRHGSYNVGERSMVWTNLKHESAVQNPCINPPRNLLQKINKYKYENICIYLA